MADKKKRKSSQFGPPTLRAGVALEGFGEVQDGEVARIERERVMAEWLAAYREGGWRLARARTDVSDDRVHGWLTLVPAFREAFEGCRDAVADRLERIADSIASGEVAASAAQVTLLQFRLRGLRPEVYRDRVQVDQRTTVAIDGGDGSRARMLLAEWSGGADAPQAALDRTVRRLASRAEPSEGDDDDDDRSAGGGEQEPQAHARDIAGA